MLVFTTKDPAATFAVGRHLAESLAAGDVICLSGDLGAGKTLLVQGIAAGLGIGEEVTSPTFTILQVYDSGSVPVYHFDLYRLDHPEELFDVGFDEYVETDGIAVIEWADKFAGYMPEKRLWVEIRTDGDSERIITVKPSGPRYEKLCEELKTKCQY